MSNYEMNPQQQPPAYYPSEPQTSYGEQYVQPSYPPHEQYSQYPHDNAFNQSHLPPMSQYKAHGENASYYSGAPMNESGEGPDGEKGVGSTVVGGAAGGYAAHHMGGGKMGTVAGAALGAVGMNMATHALKPKPQPQPQPQPQPAVFVPGSAPAMANAPVGASYGMASGSLLGGHGLGLASRRQGLLGRRAMRRGHMGLLY